MTTRVKCDLYLAGHCHHWIQARKASESRTSPRVGKLEAIDDDGFIVVRYLDKIGHYRNHDVGRLVDITRPGIKVRVFERYRLLSVDLPDGSARMFCIAIEDDEWTPCSYLPLTSATPEALAERLATRGGFSVPGNEIVDAG
jgi:hypothetical protein